jgi:hypothetical protein
MFQFRAGNWPPTPIDHYLALAPKSDWAWEFLRRNTDYQRAAAGAHSEMVQLGTAGDVVPVFFLHSQQEAARHWALCSFRRPNRLCQHRVDLLERRSPPILLAGAGTTCVR